MLTSAISQFVALLGVHWFADFVLQTHWQATNKSKRNDALAAHVGIYTMILALMTPAIFHNPGTAGLAFVAVNGAMHFATDYCTSRASSHFYAKQDWHNFFVVVGFDQFVHQITLAATAVYFFH